ncbi:hypothetical protein [Sphingobium sp. Sx8-8]|uniref:hypothetical protein n=1 Tax=Sphingobium sp. Sx8-8 TaxID=2933617 RepID=UPI001F5ADBAA|nr:hypothetical protein [Sphingobium sp. Sx8-8]
MDAISPPIVLERQPTEVIAVSINRWQAMILMHKYLAQTSGLMNDKEASGMRHAPKGTSNLRFTLIDWSDRMNVRRFS